jgi:hypothetical protein
MVIVVVTDKNDISQKRVSCYTRGINVNKGRPLNEETPVSQPLDLFYHV